MSDYKWWNDNKESVVVPKVAALAIYLSEGGEIVLRQEGGAIDDEDSFVTFQVGHIDDVIRALQELRDAK